MQLVLVTHPMIGDLRDSLRHIYNIYVEYVVKNPLYIPGTPIKYVLQHLPNCIFYSVFCTNVLSLLPLLMPLLTENLLGTKLI